MADTEFYLTVPGKILGGRGYERVELSMPHITKGRPKLASNEITIRVELNLPDTLFKDPQLTATIAVADNQVNQPTIDAGVIDNIEELIRDNAGIKLTINQVSEE